MFVHGSVVNLLPMHEMFGMIPTFIFLQHFPFKFYFVRKTSLHVGLNLYSFIPLRASLLSGLVRKASYSLQDLLCCVRLLLKRIFQFLKSDRRDFVDSCPKQKFSCILKSFSILGDAMLDRE